MQLWHGRTQKKLHQLETLHVVALSFTFCAKRPACEHFQLKVKAFFKNNTAQSTNSMASHGPSFP